MHDDKLVPWLEELTSDHSALTPALVRADPRKSLDRWALELCRPLLGPAAAAGLFESPGAPRTRANSVGHVASFMGFAERLGTIDVAEAPANELVLAVERWLSWLAASVSADDPGYARVPTLGLRHSPAPLARVSAHLNSVERHLARHGRLDLDLSRARSFAKSHDSKAVGRQSYPMTFEDLEAFDDALTDGTIARHLAGRPQAPRAEVIELWCLRESAVLRISWWAGLRVGERSKLKDDLTLVTAESVNAHLSRTKHHPEGRLITLWPREERCPVEALAKFLDRCAALGADRGGWLIPPVDRSSQHIRFRSGANMESGLSLVAGVLGKTSIDLEPATHYLANHSLRRGIASALAARGVDLERISRLLGHANALTVERYADVIVAGSIDHRELGL